MNASISLDGDDLDAPRFSGNMLDEDRHQIVCNADGSINAYLTIADVHRIAARWALLAEQLDPTDLGDAMRNLAANLFGPVPS